MMEKEMSKSVISNKKKLAMGKKAPVSLAPVTKAMKKGGVVKGKEVKVKHVAMKKGGSVKGGAYLKLKSGGRMKEC